MEQKYIYKAEVLKNEEILPGIQRMVLLQAETAEAAKPGQFLNIYPEADRLILPRPISICDADPAKKTVTIVYAVVGDGTEELCGRKRGDLVQISSPLGNGFRLPESAEHPVLLVGGGIGNAPLIFLAKRLQEMGASVTAVSGFRKEPFLTDELAAAGCRVLTTTEIPNEHAFVGTVVDCIDVNQLDIDESWNCYACGPNPMLFALFRRLSSISMKIPFQVSLEARMGCGYGVCVGCTVDLREISEDGKETAVSRKKVCSDGPVFEGKAVVW